MPEPATIAMDSEQPTEGKGKERRGRRGRRSPATAFFAAARASGGGETGRCATSEAAALGLVPPEPPQGSDADGRKRFVFPLVFDYYGSLVCEL